jgi:hypothetical protein
MDLNSKDSAVPKVACPWLKSVDDERLRIRIILKNGVIAGSDSGGILDRPPQLKTDIMVALPANGEPLVLEQSGLMH